MLSIEKQIESGCLVCPVTHQHLHVRNSELVTSDGSRTYPLKGGVPILFADVATQEEYLNENNRSMNNEYMSSPPPPEQRGDLSEGC